MRKVWPFADMSVGEKVVLEGVDAFRGQRAAHAYGQKAGKSFRTKWEWGKLIVERVEPDAPRVGKRIKHPIWDLKVGQVVEISTGEYTTTPPDVFARSVTRQTGRKFKCRAVKGKLCTWTVERVS